MALGNQVGPRAAPQHCLQGTLSQQKITGGDAEECDSLETLKPSRQALDAEHKAPVTHSWLPLETSHLTLPYAMHMAAMATFS